MYLNGFLFITENVIELLLIVMQLHHIISIGEGHWPILLEKIAMWLYNQTKLNWLNYYFAALIFLFSIMADSYATMFGGYLFMKVSMYFCHIQKLKVEVFAIIVTVWISPYLAHQDQQLQPQSYRVRPRGLYWTDSIIQRINPIWVKVQYFSSNVI